MIKTYKDINKFDVMGSQLAISQLADDRTLFLQNETQTPKALQVIKRFSNTSGLHLNLSKCE